VAAVPESLLEHGLPERPGRVPLELGSAFWEKLEELI
jgi:hypothetical protein